MPAATVLMPPLSSAGAVHPEPASGAATGSAGVAADQPAGTDNLPTADAWPIPAETGEGGRKLMTHKTRIGGMRIQNPGRDPVEAVPGRHINEPVRDGRHQRV